jgi:WhiB family redox-sensing transcriptional regulator
MTDAQLFELDFEHWREGSACRDVPDVSFFPAPDDLAATNLAKAVCESCPVVDECLSFAIETRQPDGIWGGFTPKERARLRRQWLEELRRAS